jgi:hypothetical protein
MCICTVQIIARHTGHYGAAGPGQTPKQQMTTKQAQRCPHLDTNQLHEGWHINDAAVQITSASARTRVTALPWRAFAAAQPPVPGKHDRRRTYVCTAMCVITQPTSAQFARA